MRKLEISVITLHYIRNYGSLLQTYATQKKFEQYGHSVQIIDYWRPGVTKHYTSGNLIKKAIYLVWKFVEDIKRNRVAICFLNKYINLTRRYEDYDDLKNNPPKADVYITGSDQTWNSEYNGGILPAYYLDFGSKSVKRLGYAVSIGLDDFPENEKEHIRRYLLSYDYVTVREDSAKKILNSLGYINVEHILDPTLVLSHDDWKPLIAPRRIKQKYIIIYRLNYNEDMEEYAKYLSEKTNCKIIRMSYYLTHFLCQGKMIYSPSVEMFLSLIENAEYVITDSFHCTAFALNFNKEFFVFYPGKYNTRIQSILNLTGTSHRVVSDINQKIAPIDFGYVNNVLNNERQKVDRFIKNYCC